MLEPMRRDSGPAVTVAAVLAAERDGNALVLVLAADHVIRKSEEFRDTCRSAASAAAEGRMRSMRVIRLNGNSLDEPRIR